MRRRALLPVLDEEDDAYAEHAVALLNQAYRYWGNLDGTTCGLGGMSATLRKSATDVTWKNAANICIEQGVYIPNAKEVEEQREFDRFCLKYLKEGSEVLDLTLAKDSCGESEHALGNALIEVAKKCKLI
jgi:hypothetical protein